MADNLPTASGSQSGPCSGRLQALREAKLEPASPLEAVALLGSCLTLVGSTGMTEDTRAEWLRVAQMTLADMPADLLARGCAKARRTCEFPSQVVPIIVEEVEGAMSCRRDALRRMSQPRLVFSGETQPEPEYADPADIAALIAKIGQ